MSVLDYGMFNYFLKPTTALTKLLKTKKPDTFISGFVLLLLLGSNQGPSD